MKCKFLQFINISCPGSPVICEWGSGRAGESWRCRWLDSPCVHAESNDAAEVMGSFQKTASRKIAENTVKHRDGSVRSVVANHCGGGESSVVVRTLPPNHHRHRGVSHCSRWSFWMQFLIPHEHTASRVGDTAHPSPHIPFPTHKQQDCRDSRDSLGTVLSETVMTVSLSAPPYRCVQWAISAFQDNWERSRSRDILLFSINNPSLGHRPIFATGTSTMVACQKTTTDRVANSCHHNSTTENNRTNKLLCTH